MEEETRQRPGQNNGGVVMFGMVSPTLINKSLQPDYPLLAKRSSVEGSVKIEIFISEEGLVFKSKVLDYTDKAFVVSAENYVKELKFTPATFGGMNVVYSSTMVINYKLT